MNGYVLGGKYFSNKKVVAEEVTAPIVEETIVEEVVETTEVIEAPVEEVVEETIEEAPVVKATTKKKESKFSKINDLSKIKGIGIETSNDIGLIYGSVEELIVALKSNKPLPLRNDIEEKLKKELI